jgi:hypothetical protein
MSEAIVESLYDMLKTLLESKESQETKNRFTELLIDTLTTRMWYNSPECVEYIMSILNELVQQELISYSTIYESDNFPQWAMMLIQDRPELIPFVSGFIISTFETWILHPHSLKHSKLH